MANSYEGNPDQFRHLWEKGYEFDLGKYINRGWELFKENVGSFMLYALVLAVATGGVEFMGMNDGLGGLVQLLIGAPLAAGMFIVGDKIARKESYEFGDFFKGFEHMLQLVIGNLVFTTMVVLGILILVIPGIYLAIACMLWMPLVLFEDLNFWKALETSRKIVSKNWWNFFLLGLVFVGILLLGALAFGIGLFAAIPVVYLSVYAVYEDLIANNDTLESKIDEIGIEIEEINDFDDV